MPHFIHRPIRREAGRHEAEHGWQAWYENPDMPGGLPHRHLIGTYKTEEEAQAAANAKREYHESLDKSGKVAGTYEYGVTGVGSRGRDER